jgi:hypothetical protein
MTDLGEYAAAAHSDDVAELVRTVQGWVIHPFHAHLYGVDPGEDGERQLQNRSVREMLSELPGYGPQPPAARTIGNCRHFATLLTGLLRAREIPARARCGFGAYFEPPRYCDHWVCEYWNAAQGRWILVDAQIDDAQRKAMGIELDTLDLGREDFWVAGQAWQRCRSGEVDPMHFGILDMWGLWFVRGNLLRDLAALCKVELLPWDAWGLINTEMKDLAPQELELLDRVAGLTVADEIDTGAVRALYEEHDSLRVPSRILSYRPDPRPVELGELCSDRFAAP